MNDGVEMVLWALQNAKGSEILVPKIPSYRIKDIAEAIGPNCKKEIVGIRPGEKIHEEMITSADSFSTYDLGEYYMILPSDRSVEVKYKEKGVNLKNVPQGFSYSSNTNNDFLSIEQLRMLIKKHVDPNFRPL